MDRTKQTVHHTTTNDTDAIRETNKTFEQVKAAKAVVHDQYPSLPPRTSFAATLFWKRYEDA